jgi:hypothetical protein
MFAAIEKYSAEFRQALYDASTACHGNDKFVDLNDDAQNYRIMQIDMVRETCKELAK